MVYKNNIPQPGQSPSTQSQADLLENFTQIGLQYGTAVISDHVAFNAGSDNGLHKRVRINDIQADPGLTFPQTQIYEKHVGITPDRFPNLYWESKPENAAIAASIFPLNAIKAWVRFVGNAASPIAPTDGFNVTNVTHGGLGRYTVNFTNNLENANYAVFMMTNGAAGQIFTTAVSDVVVQTVGLSQPTIVTVMVIGT